MTDTPTIEPGIYQLDEGAYHSGPGVSKSGLWKLYTRTPFHFRFGEQKESPAMAFGTAAHCAVLEPGLFETRFYRGPSDRRGNKWGAAQEIATAAGKECITEGDYDDALRLRDALQRNRLIQALTSGTPSVEQSAYWNDPETGELIRCRPDLYHHDLRVMADLKSTTDASAATWAKRCADFGYHMQEAVYTEGWQAAGGGAVDAFVFITVEKDAPFAHAVYELEPSAVIEGQAAYRKALALYSTCRQADHWPSYSHEVTALDLPNWGYRETKREHEE